MAGAAGRAGGRWGDAAARAGAAGTGAGFGCAGLTGAEESAPAAFFTDRIDLPGAGFEGAAAGREAPPLFNIVRILPASASLIELLWLLAAMDSFSAASSTSLLSRPRSLDSS